MDRADQLDAVRQTLTFTSDRECARADDFRAAIDAARGVAASVDGADRE